MRLSQCMSPLALLCLTLCSACGSTNKGSSSSGPATLGALERTVNARWNVDPASAACTTENLERTCRYLFHGVHITVSFNQQGHAEQIVVDGQRHPSVNMW